MKGVKEGARRSRATNLRAVTTGYLKRLTWCCALEKLPGPVPFECVRTDLNLQQTGVTQRGSGPTEGKTLCPHLCPFLGSSAHTFSNTLRPFMKATQQDRVAL